MALLDAKPDPDSLIPGEGASPVTDEIPLRSVKAISAHIPIIEESRDKITAEMETMVLTGLATTVSPTCICMTLTADRWIRTNRY